MTSTGNPFDHVFYTRFLALADCMVPSYGMMPSYSQSCTSSALQKSMTFRPDLCDAFYRAVESYNQQEPRNHLKSLEQSDPEAFAALGTLVLCTYYMSPNARKALGYGGQERMSLTNLPKSLLALERLLTPVRLMDKRFRIAP